MRRTAKAIGAGAALLAFWAALAAPAALALEGALGEVVLRSTRTDLFPKWQSALARARAEAGCAKAGRCAPDAWRRFLAGLAGASPTDQLRAVNAWVNRAPYRPDRDNYGAADVWATPRQLFARGGDCEDFALAKYLSLRALGFAAAALRLVVVEDRGVPHAILTAEAAGRLWVLDNRRDAVAEPSALRPARPIYAINEEGWWLYRRVPAETGVAAYSAAARAPAAR